MEATACASETPGRVDGHLMALHHPQPRHEADQRDVWCDAQRATCIGAVESRMKARRVDATRQRDDALGWHEAGGEILLPNRFRHRDDETGGLAVEPPIQ